MRSRSNCDLAVPASAPPLSNNAMPQLSLEINRCQVLPDRWKGDEEMEDRTRELLGPTAPHRMWKGAIDMARPYGLMSK
jgi:hypothetical protein